MKRMLPAFLLLVPLLMSTSCIKKIMEKFDGKSTAESAKPEDVVKKFVELSASIKGDGERTRLQELCIGEMRRAFERMTPEAFRLAYVNGGVKIKSITVQPATMDDSTAKVSYVVDIENSQGTQPTQETSEREVDLVKDSGSWFIDSIRPKGSDKIAFTRGMIF